MSESSNDCPVIALIPVRGGSKGIPKKNVKPLAGRPLVEWVVRAASAAEEIDEVSVATDCDKIWSVVENFGLPKVKLVGRSQESATDTASTESVMLEFACNFPERALLVLIQATSPLVGSHDLDAAIRYYRNAGVDSLLSVVRQKRFVWRPVGQGVVEPVNYDPVARPRRQDFEGFLVENGAFYVMRIGGLRESGCRLHGRVGFYEMAQESYCELDEHSDWAFIEAVLAERGGGFASPRRPIRMFVTDVDGVLTDGGMYYSESGGELKKFNTRDGMGMQLLREAGVTVGIITSEDTQIVMRRASKLKVDFLHQGVGDKLKVLEAECEKRGIGLDEVAYIGDDINDLACLGRVGLSACPADAVERVKRCVKVVLPAAGGAGAVRDFATMILDGMRAEREA